MVNLVAWFRRMLLRRLDGRGARRPFHPHSYFLAVGGNTPFKRRYIAASA
jgi:hypothetical protein